MGAMASTASQRERYSKQHPWYHATFGDHIKPKARKLLQEYSCIPANEVDDHIFKMRDLLWSQGPYPCIGEFRFLTINILQHPLFPRILALLSFSQPPSSSTTVTINSQRSSSPPSNPQEDAPALLSLGCCIAQDLRYLTSIGIPSTSLYGTDINSLFLSSSYTVFRDAATFNGTLIAADFFSPSLFSKEFKGWEGKFSIVQAACFLHLFEWEKQVEIGKRVVRLLRNEPGVFFVGEMVGVKWGGLAKTESTEGKAKATKNYLHDAGSFERLWGEVAVNTGTVGQWKISAELKIGDPEKGKGAYFVGEGTGWLTFGVERV